MISGIPDECFLHWGGATMAAPGESCKEARSTKRSHGRSLLTPKDHLNIGYWNVRTMYTIAKTATVMKNQSNQKAQTEHSWSE